MLTAYTQIKRYGRYFLLLVVSGLVASLAIDDIPWSSLSYFDDDNDDNQLFNLYERALSRNAVHPVIERIAVVAVDDCSRKETGLLLELLAEANPACIGLDIVYAELSESDSVLVDGLCSVAPILLWPYVDANVPSNDFYLSEFMGGAEPVDVMLNVAGRNMVCNIPLQGDSLGIQPMAIVMAKRIAPSSYRNFVEKAATVENLPIVFSLGEIEVFEAREILESPSLAEQLNNRAVFVGIVHSVDDTHPTLLDYSTPGVIIQAMSLATIISESYPKHMAAWLAWLIGGIFASLTLWVSVVCDGKDFSNLISRIIPCVILVFLVISGYKIYVSCGYIIDIGPIMLWPGAAMLVFDVVNGLKCIGSIIYKRIRK